MENVFPKIAYSPETTLAANITGGATTIAVADITVLPPAPNVATIRNPETGVVETIKYERTSGNQLQSITRAIEPNDIARTWSVGSLISSTYTAHEHNALINEINRIHTPIQLPYYTDANTIITPGVYRILTVEANLPILGASWGVLEVLHENVQRYTNENSTPAYRSGVWVRVRVEGAWQPWREIGRVVPLTMDFQNEEIEVDINDIAELMLDDMTSEKKKALAERTKLRHAKEAKEIELFRSRRKRR